MYVNDSHHLHKHCTQTTTVCPPECVPDQRQRRCCRHDMQFAVCHFLISRNRIKFIDLLNYGNSSFVLKFRNKFMVAVTFFFTQTFNEMFIFVGECRDFTDANITSLGKGCQWHVRNTFTSMISIYLHSCTPKITKICSHLKKVIVKKWVAHFLLDTVYSRVFDYSHFTVLHLVHPKPFR